MASNLAEALENAVRTILGAVTAEVKEMARIHGEEEKAKGQLKSRIFADYYVAVGKDMPADLEDYLADRINQGWETYRKYGQDLRVVYRYAISELGKINSPLVTSGVSITLDQTLLDYVLKKKGELEEKLKQLS